MVYIFIHQKRSKYNTTIYKNKTHTFFITSSVYIDISDPLTESI